MKLLLAALVPLLWAGVAAAAPGPNLGVTITPPAPTYVYAVGRYTVTVANTGTQHAPGSSVAIALPRTSTSPQVYVMGTVTGYSPGCTLAGTTLTCNFGQINKNTSRTVWVDIKLPYSAAPIVFTATASTTGNDSNPANNVANHTASLLYHAVTAGPAGTAVNWHCTGTTITSFFECTLFPSSLSSHDAIFHPDHTISFPLEPDYAGTWSQTGATDLSFTYTYLGDVVATFTGRGVDSNCFEGMTTFPPPSGPTYVSAYEVCF